MNAMYGIYSLFAIFVGFVFSFMGKIYFSDTFVLSSYVTKIKHAYVYNLHLPSAYPSVSSVRPY